MPNTSRPAALLIDQGRETGNAQGPNGLSPTQNSNNQSSLALHSPSQSSSRPSSSRSSSRPSTPKWVPPALEQKLQHYRDNPVALRQLNQRVKQYSRPSSPRKTPTAAAAAVQAGPPWTISSHPLDSTSTASSSNCQPADVMVIDHEAVCAEQHASATQCPALSSSSRRQSSTNPHEPDPQPLQQCHTQQQDEMLLLIQDPATQGHQQQNIVAQVHEVLGLQTELELQLQLQQSGDLQHALQAQQHDQEQQQPFFISHHLSTSTGLQDTSQATCQHSSCNAALQLQLLIEEHEQQQQHQAPAGQDGQAHLSTPEVWQHIQAAQLHQQATLIQKSWRDVLVVRAAQQQLLCCAMLQLEQQLVRSSAAAAAAAARAEARAQLAAGAAAGRGTMHPMTSTSSNSPMTRAHSATRTAASAAGDAAAGLEDGHCHPAHDTAAAAVDKDSLPSAPPPAAAGGRMGWSAAPQPWCRGGPLVLPGDFFDAVDGLEEDSYEGSSSNTPQLAAAASSGVGGSAAAAAAVRTGGAGVCVSPKQPADAAGTTLVTVVAAAGGGRRRPQSACPQPTAAAAATAATPQQSSNSSSRRPQSARSPQHSAPRPQSAAASRPASAVPKVSGALGLNHKGVERQPLNRPTSAAAPAVNAMHHHQQQQQQGSATPAGSRPGSAGSHNHNHSSSKAQHHRTGRAPANAATAEAVTGAAFVSEAAAALPQGLMPPRGVQMSGQLTPLTARADSAGNWAAFAPPGTACAAAAAACVGGVQAATASTGETVLALGSSRSLEQQQQVRVRQRAGGGGGGSGGGVGWQEGVVDLEIEAQLKRLTDVLPDDIRQQVAAGQLAAARRQLLQARAAHQELVVRTRQQRATEAALHTTLTAVTGSATLTASKVALLPPQPHLQLIPNRQRLKQMVAAGITLQQQRMQAAAAADSDTAGLEARLVGSSSTNGSSSGGGGSRGVSGNGGLSSGGGRWNG